MNGQDKSVVEGVARKLKSGINPWFDNWHLVLARHGKTQSNTHSDPKNASGGSCPLRSCRN
jgi:hypothetical protein